MGEKMINLAIDGVQLQVPEGTSVTSEITALRRTLTPMVERVCRLWLRLHGYGCRFAVEWDDINLQDLVEEAKAELYREQARRLRLENDEREEQV